MLLRVMHLLTSIMTRITMAQVTTNDLSSDPSLTDGEVVGSCEETSAERKWEVNLQMPWLRCDLVLATEGKPSAWGNL